MTTNKNDWQGHGHSRGLRVLCDERAGEFDRQIAAFARVELQTTIRTMTAEGAPQTKIELARRLGVSRNRVPALLEVLGVAFPLEPAS